jgi:hypothetical protein
MASFKCRPCPEFLALETFVEWSTAGIPRVVNAGTLENRPIFRPVAGFSSMREQLFLTYWAL